jgi:hypothetical protein
VVVFWPYTLDSTKLKSFGKCCYVHYLLGLFKHGFSILLKVGLYKKSQNHLRNSASFEKRYSDEIGQNRPFQLRKEI